MKKIENMERKTTNKIEVCQVERALRELMERTLKMENELMALGN